MAKFPIQLFTVMASCLVTVSIAQADTVTLTTGEILTGEVISQTDDAITLEHPVLGTVAIPAAGVTTVGIDGQPAAAQADAAAPAPAPEPEPEAEPEPAPKKREWKQQLEVGLNGAQGNTEKLDFRAVYRATREREDVDRTKFTAGYFTAEQNNQTSQNEFKATLVHDWLMVDSRWFLTADATYEFDDFEPWTHRVTAHIGPGYDLIRKEDLDVTLRSGFGAYYETGSGYDDQLEPEAKLGADLTWRIAENQTFNAATTFYPSLGEFGEFRWVNSADYTIALDVEKGLSLKFGVEDEYVSETEGDSKHNDLKFYGALLMDF